MYKTPFMINQILPANKLASKSNKLINLISTLCFFFLVTFNSYGQTYYTMSSGTYTQSFTGWTAYATNWNGVGVLTTGTIPAATKTTADATSIIIAPSSTGGVQSNSSATNILFLSTGATDNSTSTAADLNLNFTGRNAGTFSFDAAEINNSTGNRVGTLRVYYSLDNTNWTELTGTDLPFVATNNVAKSATISISLPSALNNQSTVKLRFYYHNGSGGTTGSRPKISVDNVSVSSTAMGSAPAASTINSITPGNAQLSVAFTAGSDGGATITNYKYSTDGGATFTAFSPAQTTSPLTISGLTNGTTYSVQIKAVNSVGDGTASSSVSGTPVTTPSAPTISSITPSNGQISIAFTAGSDGGATITDYKYSTDGGTTYTLAGTTASPIVVTGLSNGTTYSVKLKAVNSIGDGAASNSVSSTPRTVPSAPSITAITSGNALFSVAFTAGSDGGSAISNYEYSTDGGSTFTACSPAQTTSPIVINGLTNGTTYSVTIRAVNIAGSGTSSASVNGTPEAPSSPTLFASGSIASMTTIYGTASSASSFTVSGTALTNDVTVTPPSGFEVSQTSSTAGFATTQTITQSAGVVSSTTIYIRLKNSNNAGNYSGNVTVSSTGATDVTISIASSTVNTKSLTITGITGANKVYDRNRTATYTGTPSYTGLQNGESFTVTGTPTALFSDSLVGIGKSITLNGFTAPSSNYSVTQPALTANITPLYLTVSGATGVSKIFDSTSIATFTGTLNGVISPDVVTLNTAASFASSNAGTAVAITSNSTISGANASNYLLTQPTGLSADINKANQTITFGSLANKFTTDAPFILNGSASSKLLVTYSSSNTSVATVSGNTVTIFGAGTTVITASQSGDNNYNAATDVTQNLVVVNPPLYLNNFTGTGVCPTQGNTPVVVSNVTGDSVTRSTTTCTTLSNLFNSTTLNNTSSVSNSSYIQFAVKANSGYQLNVNSLSFFRQGSGTAPNQLEVRYSTDNFVTSTSWGAAPSTPTTGTYITWDFPDFSTANAGKVFFRLYPYGTQRADGTATAAASTGTFRIDSVLIQGAATAVVPIIAASGTLSSLSTTYGTPSSTSSFSLNGTDMNTGITVTPPAGFEVSTSSTFASNVGNSSSPLVVGTSGNLSSTTVYVRLRANASVAASPYSGNIICSSTGAVSVNVATASSNVSPKGLTISGITGSNKVYDGNSSASYTGTAAYSGLENSEFYSVVGTATAVFADSLVGNSKSISVTGFDAPSSDYTLTQPSLSANITPKALSLNGITAENKVYDGNTNASVIGTATLNGVLGNDIGNVTLNGTSSASFSDANVGNGKTVTVSGYSISGTAASNYSLGNTILSADITKANQSITFTLSSPVVYPVVSSITLGASSNSGLAITYSSSNTSVATVSGNILTILSDGTTSITATQSGNINYNAASSVSQTLEVQVSSLQNQTITFNSLSAKTYGDADFAPGATASSALTVIYSSSNTSVATIVSGSVHIVGSGTTTITATQDGDNVYNPAPSVDRALVIDPKSLTVTAATAQNKAYDGTTTATINNVTLNGVVGTDDVSVSGGGTFADKNVGTAISVTASLSLTGTKSGNYTLSAQPSGLSADINPKEITITGLSFSNKSYDGNDFASPNSIPSLSGVVAADINDVYLFEDFASFNFSSTAVGNNISIIINDYFLDGSAAGNYSLIIPTNLTANITPLSLYITGLTANNKVYDGSTTTTLSGTPVLNGILSGEESQVSLSGTPAANFASAGFGNGKSVTVTGYTLSGSLAGNYTLSAPSGLTANISKAALTVFGITANNKVYDRTKTATLSGTAELSGLASTDGLTVTLGGTPVALFNDSIVGTSKPVTITGYSVSGSGIGNYDFTQPTGLTANITQATQTITFNTIPIKSTGDANFKLTATATSFLPVSYSSSNSSVATIQGDTLVVIVGAGTSVITASQAGNTNYLPATNVQQTLTILPAIAKWGFDAITTANTGTTVNLGSGSTAADQGVQTSGSSFTAVHSSASTVWSNPAGNGSTKAISSNNWTVGDYYQFVVNTNGYYNISVLFDQTGSNTGPRNFKLQYSKNGTSIQISHLSQFHTIQRQTLLMDGVHQVLTTLQE